MGISWGGGIYPWKSAAVISSILIGGAMLVALFVYEGTVDLKYPAIPVKFFANRGFISLVACATVASVSAVKKGGFLLEIVSDMFCRCSTTRQCFSGLNRFRLCTRKTSLMLAGSR